MLAHHDAAAQRPGRSRHLVVLLASWCLFAVG
jgi:hypothetical protein